jgi:hypothetical protein
MRRLIPLLVAITLAGCATAVDKPVRETIAPPRPVQIAAQRRQIADLLEDKVEFRGASTTARPG